MSERITIELDKTEAQELYAVGEVLMEDTAAMDRLADAGVDQDKLHSTLEKIGRKAFEAE